MSGWEFGGLSDMFGKPKKVVRTVPLRPEWVALLQRIEELQADKDRLKDEFTYVSKKREALRRKLQVLIEDDLECYDEFRINEKQQVVELLDDDPDGDV